jgi:hypothetical protein
MGPPAAQAAGRGAIVTNDRVNVALEVLESRIRFLGRMRCEWCRGEVRELHEEDLVCPKCNDREVLLSEEAEKLRRLFPELIRDSGGEEPEEGISPRREERREVRRGCG